MRILLLGISGMIGHKLAQILDSDFDLVGLSRKKVTSKQLGLKNTNIVYHDLLKEDIQFILNEINPDIIINCVAITTRRGVEGNVQITKKLNTELPHKLDSWAVSNSKKLIHFSTDCVFSGNRGNYLENDFTDADDIYGKTKADGEVNSESTLTLRCSIIGRELYNFTELFEWLVENKNKKISGYSRVIYSGITTVRMGKIIKKIIKEYSDLSGIYNISSIPISKFELLTKLSNAFNLNVDINENKNIKSNKVLISRKFTEITGINPPNWDDLIEEFKKDSDKNKSLYKN